MIEKLFVIAFLFARTSSLPAQIAPPNFNFELNSLDIFMPGKNVSAAGAFKEVNRNEDITQLRFQIKQNAIF